MARSSAWGQGQDGYGSGSTSRLPVARVTTNSTGSAKRGPRNTLGFNRSIDIPAHFLRLILDGFLPKWLENAKQIYSDSTLSDQERQGYRPEHEGGASLAGVRNLDTQTSASVRSVGEPPLISSLPSEVLTRRASPKLAISSSLGGAALR